MSVVPIVRGLSEFTKLGKFLASPILSERLF